LNFGYVLIARRPFTPTLRGGDWRDCREVSTRSDGVGTRRGSGRSYSLRGCRIGLIAGAPRRPELRAHVEACIGLSRADRPASRQATSIAPAPSGCLQTCFILPAVPPCAGFRNRARTGPDRSGRRSSLSSRRERGRWRRRVESETGFYSRTRLVKSTELREGRAQHWKWIISIGLDRIAPLWLDQRCSCGLAEIPVSEAVCAAPEANALTAIAASVTRAMRAKYCTYASGDHENVNLMVRVSTELGNTKIGA
jgi:hypothetical protein